MGRHLFGLLVFAVAVVSAIVVVGCPKGGGSGNDPCEGFSGICADLTPWVTTEGTGAMLRQASTADLLEGPVAQGGTTDWYLANENIRVIVQGDVRSSGISPFGGTIIDADIVRPSGEPSRDGFDELFQLFNFGGAFLPQEFKIFRDGSDGGSAVLAVAGVEHVNDGLNVGVLLEDALGPIGKLWADPDEDLPLEITHYFIINPGEHRVRMLTAVRNNSTAAFPLILVELMGRGNITELFNATRPNGSRFGYTALIPEPSDDYLAHVDPDVAYGYAPVGWNGADETNLSLTVSGVTGSVVGGEDLFDFTGDQPASLPPGVVQLEPDREQTVLRDFYVAADLAGITAAWEADNGTALGEVSGTVSPADLPTGTRVAVQNSAGKTYTTFAVRAGAFAGRLPEGTFTLSVDAPGYPFSADESVTVSAGTPAAVSFTLPGTGKVELTVTTDSGAATPAKAVFICAGTCPKADAGDYRETNFDPHPNNVQHVALVPVSGRLDVLMPPGDYQLVVSRGAEWSTFPNDWPTTPYDLTVTAGGTHPVAAQISQVLDTAGWISGDLHVHAIGSPDSPVPNTERVATMLAEGVDVLVATDHNFVTDFTPFVEALGATGEIATVIGNEVTTFDAGHFNAFPVEHDPADIMGGAFDWGNGTDPTLTPDEIFKAIKAQTPVRERVIQINHPRGSLGHFSAIGLDLNTGKTTADPARFRMSTAGVTGDDTRLFSNEFTALEILNGHSVSSLRPRMNDWFALLSHGRLVTATAVSDTHAWYNGDMGVPRSWVRVGPTSDTPATFDSTAFVAAINAGKLMGSNGPFVRAIATAGTATAEPGDLLALAAPGNPVTIDITIEVPSWYGFDQIKLFANVTDTAAPSGSQVSTPPTPADSIAVDLSTEATVAGASTEADPASTHRRWVVTRSFTVNPTEDTWYVVFVEGSASSFPVILGGDGALAFTNAIYVDADGDGVFAAPRSFQKGPVQRAPARVWDDRVPRRMTPEDLRRLRKIYAH